MVRLEVGRWVEVLLPWVLTRTACQSEFGVLLTTICDNNIVKSVFPFICFPL